MAEAVDVDGGGGGGGAGRDGSEWILVKERGISGRCSLGCTDGCGGIGLAERVGRRSGKRGKWEQVAEDAGA